VRVSAKKEAIGYATKFKGQEYRFLGPTTYVNRRGDEFLTFHWEANCADCGDRFEVLVKPFSESPQKRRCNNCKAPGKRVAS